MIAKVLDTDFVNNPSLSGHIGPGWTCTRGSNAMMEDADGWLREVQDDEPRFPGATFRQNVLLRSQLDAAPPTSWTEITTGGTQSNAGTATETDGGIAIRFQASTNRIYDQGPFPTLQTGHTYLMSVFVEDVVTEVTGANTEIFSVLSLSDATGTTGLVATTADIGTRIYATFTVGTDTSGVVRIGIGMAGNCTGDVTVSAPMIEDVSGRISPTPSDYIPTTTVPVSQYSGTSLGWLGEPAATNLCLQSNDLTTTWTLNGAETVITANQSTSPDGSLTLDLISVDNVGGTAFVGARQNINVAASTDYFLSAYVESNAKGWCYLRMALLGTLAISVYFDIDNETVGTVGANVTGYGIEPTGITGLKRIWLRFTSDPTDLNGYMDIFAADANNDITITRDGSDCIYAGCVQLEVATGLERPTSYIPTTTATVTRALGKLDADDLSWYNNPAMTFYADFVSYSAPASGTAHIFTVNYGNGNNEIRLGYIGSLNLNAICHKDATVEFSISPSGVPDFALDAEVRAAFAATADDASIYVDGAGPGTDTTVTMPTETMTTMTLGSRFGTGVHNGLTKRIVAYNDRLSDVQLAALSQGTLPTFGRDLMDYSLTFPLTGSLPIVPTYRWDYE